MLCLWSESEATFFIQEHPGGNHQLYLTFRPLGHHYLCGRDVNIKHNQRDPSVRSKSALVTLKQYMLKAAYCSFNMFITSHMWTILNV